jgi:guanylate kinase
VPAARAFLAVAVERRGEAVTRGRLWILSAPSGAGKTSLVRALTARHPGLRFSVSYTTRPRRAAERHGEDYFFVTPEAFRRMAAAGEFLEHAEVFGNLYGTSRSQVEGELAAGHDVLLEIDWQGARQVRARLPECHSVFVLPPSLEELERRLRGRGTDSEAVIERRLGEALDDIGHWPEFEHVIVNDALDEAAATLRALMAGEPRATRTDDPAVRRSIEARFEPLATPRDDRLH